MLRERFSGGAQGETDLREAAANGQQRLGASQRRDPWYRLLDLGLRFSWSSAGAFLRNAKTWKLFEFIGAPGRIRTHDPQIRSLVLYPAELPVRLLGTSSDFAPVHCRKPDHCQFVNYQLELPTATQEPITGLHLPPCAAPYSAFSTFGTSG